MNIHDDVALVSVRRTGDIGFNHKSVSLLQLKDPRNAFITLWTDKEEHAIGFTITQKPTPDSFKVQKNRRDIRFTAISALNILGVALDRTRVCKLEPWPIKGSGNPKWFFKLPKD